MVARVLIHFDGANGSQSLVNEVSGGAAIICSPAGALTTADKKFGTASFNGKVAGSHFRTDEVYTLDGPFCIAIQVRRDGFTGKYWAIGYEGTNYGIQLDHFVGDAIVQKTGTTRVDLCAATGDAIPNNNSAWTHVAVTRDASNVIRIFVNGVVQGSVTDATTFVGRLIGGDKWNSSTPGDAEGAPSNAFLDEFLLDVGDPVYTANFTPPTAPYALTSPDVTAALSGNGATGSVGSVTQSRTRALTSALGTGGVGAIIEDRVHGLSGNAAAGQVGDVAAPSVPTDVTVAATGVEATSAVGDLAEANAVGLAGAEATGSVGDMLEANAVGLAGVEVTGTAGSIGAGAAVALTGVVGTALVETDPLAGLVALLFRGNSANDLSSHARTGSLQGDAVIANDRFTFDGSGGQFRVPYDPADDFGALDFTIEGKARFLTTAGYQVLFSTRQSDSASLERLSVYWNPTINRLVLAVGTGGGATQNPAGVEAIINTVPFDWAVERAAGVVTLYVNGAALVSQSVGTIPINSGTGAFTIGSTGSDMDATFNGEIWDVRSTVGAARYGGAYTPPTSLAPAGGIRPETALPTSGTSATGEVGDVDAPAVDVTRALTGVAAAGEVGDAAESNAVALANVLATGATGAVLASPSVALAGNAATATVGTLAALVEQSAAVSGVEAASSLGSVAPQSALPLVGVEAAASPGAISAGNDVNVGLSGTAATGSVAGVGQDRDLPLAGLAATAGLGTIAFGEAFGLSGTAAAGEVGDIGAGADVSAGLTGVAADGSVGTLEAMTDRLLTGVEATAAFGTLGVDVLVALEGVEAIGEAVGILTGRPTDTRWIHYTAPAERRVWVAAPERRSWTAKPERRTWKIRP